MDSLRYWVEVVPRRRLPLRPRDDAGTRPQGFDPDAAFFAAVRQDPVLDTLKLIAEPWDIGLGGYQVGDFPPGWSEWNDRFRRHAAALSGAATAA